MTAITDHPAAPATPQGRARAQRAEALELANLVRLARACWRRRLATRPDAIASRDLAAEILEDVPEVLAGMDLGDLLGACKGVGPRGVERLARAASVRPSKTLRALTPRQRAMLIGALRLRNRHAHARDLEARVEPPVAE